MKTSLIIILAVALLAVAYFTRPSQRSFDLMVRDQLTAEAASPAGAVIKGAEATLATQDVVYKDRYLWVDVERDGKTIYTGAFGHWFQWGKVVEAPAEKTQVQVKLPV